MKTLNHPDLETVGLEIRSLNGKDALFTTDGKLLANQSESGHIYYVRDDRGRRHKTFRASFLVDNESVTLQGPYEQKQDPVDSDRAGQNDRQRAGDETRPARDDRVPSDEG